MSAYVKHLMERAVGVVPEQRIREWAASNAFTLIFLVVMFVLTWALLVYEGTK